MKNSKQLPPVCELEADVVSLPVDDALVVDGLELTIQSQVTYPAAIPGATPAPSVRDTVVIAWDLVAGAPDCIWISVSAPNERTFPDIAVAMTVGDATRVSHEPVGRPGDTFCFRAIAVAADRRGPASESCIAVAHPRQPPVEIVPIPAVEDGASNAIIAFYLAGGLLVGAIAALVARFGLQRFRSATLRDI